MASLSGNKIKDTFNLLLKLANSNVGSSEQVVQDGAGNNSALKISTDTVETTGALKISGTPSTSTSVTSALMLSSSGVVVTRNLSTSPIGTASITANTPLSATGSTIELKDPALLSQINQPANNDKYLIWDESTSAYKYIDQSDLATAVGNSITAGTLTQGIMFARQSATRQMSTTAVTAIGTYAEIYEDSSATTATTATGSSVYFGTLVNTASPPLNGLTIGAVSDPRDAVLINEIEGWFRITGTIQVILTAGADFNIEVAGTIIRSITTSADAGEISTITLQALYYSDGVSGYHVRLTGKADGIGVNVYATQTSLEVDYMGDNATL